jgi:hypothetical protein
MKLDSNALLKSAGIGAGAMLVLTLLAQIPLVGIACCCLIWLGYAGIGALYGVFARQNGALISAGPIALGGALAAAIAGVVQGIISGIVTLVFTSADMMTQTLVQLQQQGIDIPPEMYDVYTSGVMGPLAAVMGICMAIVFGAVLGAIGGAIYGATQSGKGTPAVAESPPSPSDWD